MEVYVDDMLVKSRRSQDHLEHLEQAFNIMRTYGIERGIEANPEKIQAIMSLRSPITIKDVQKLTDKSLPFFKILRKTKNFEWNEECKKALQDLKDYLVKPPLLANPKEGEVLFLYLAVSESAVSSVLVREEGGNQSPVYYVSKMLHGAESRYSEMEKLTLALVVIARMLRPYFQSHRVVVLTNHQLKQAQVLADFVMELSSDPKEQNCKWMLHVDGSSNANNGGAGILIEGPKEIEGTYETREKMMTSYRDIVKRWMGKFDKCSILQVPRTENDKANALSKFGATMTGIKNQKITTLVREQSVIIEKIEVQAVSMVESWKDEIDKYLEYGTLPNDLFKAKRVRFRAARFTLLSGQLYKRTVDGPLLKCLDEERAEYVMREIPEGSYGNHSGARFRVPRILISDNGTQFQGRKITEWCKELKIVQHFTAVANLQANGQTEVTNRTILQHLKIRLESKGSWVEELPGVLWAYRTTPRTATGETPFFLVYGTEAIIPAEIEEESQRIVMYDPKSNQNELNSDLTLIEEKRDAAYDEK
ncbi:UNVERIFIED_CONTAM: hypothetical protein Sindi_2479000 [Sesamum indicum]